MIEDDLIIGSGGGGGKARKPKEVKDNLDSTQNVTLVDLISEGEIQGLKDGYKSIYLDNTVLQNPDGSFNFQNVTVYTTTGTQNQDPIPFSPQVEDERAVAITVTTDYPITRTITDTNVDAVRVTISVPQLQEFKSNGDILGASVRLQIQVQYNGGGFTTAIDDTITGRTADLYQRDYVVNLTGAFPVEVRVVRVTPDSTNSKLIDEILWSAYTEITFAKLNYPNSALVALRSDAEQFSRVPTRSYLVRGIKVKIPNNATVDSKTGRLIYAGIWNGTFGAAAWTTDPAWILWDLLTSTRYGFGTHIQASQLDKWSFYEASKYCAELVPDGFGGTEPRFTCNVNIQTREEAYKLINDMCSVFRAMPYWSTGSLTVTQDKPADPAYLFTLANVSEEGFSYQGSSLKGRPTVAVVSYLDLSQRDIAYETVEDKDAIAKYGVITTEISAFACTSRGQASRIGEWVLYSSRYETEVVSFTASIDAGVIVRPGQIINISDPVRAGSRRGGRITSATTTAITVDDATGLTLGTSPLLSVILPGGTVETKSVSSIAGGVITVSSAFSSAPNVNSVWVYETNDLQTSTWRVLGVQEQDGSKYAITALEYNASKYAYIERGAKLQERDVTNLNVKPDPPKDLTATEVLYENQGRAASKIILNWTQVIGVTQYRVRWRVASGNWTVETIQRPDYEILDNTAATYEIQVYSLSAGLLQSTLPATLMYMAAGKTAPPTDVSNVQLIPTDEGNAILSWNRATDLDVLLGGKVLIRHQAVSINPVWERGQTIVAAASGNQTQKLVPLLEGTYLVKFEDDGGRRSVNATTAVISLPTPQPRLLVKTYAEDLETPPFNGNRINTVYDLALDGLIIASGTAVDAMATDGNWDALPSIDSVGGVLPQGEYEFGSTFDLGGVFDVNLQRRFVARPYLPAALWDDKITLIDSWQTIDETNIDGADAKLYVRTTLNDPAATPVWGPWKEFVNAMDRGRGYQFKVIAMTNDADNNILIEQLGAVMELQQRTERSSVLTSGGGTYGVVFTNAFYQTPSIGITASNMATGDYFTIGTTSRQGFQVTFRDASGAAVSRNFTYTAVGFGREIV